MITSNTNLAEVIEIRIGRVEGGKIIYGKFRVIQKSRLC